MTDFRLIALLHGRAMLPFTVLILILGCVRLFFDDLVVQQVYGIGLMLLFAGLSIYAFDSTIRFLGLADDSLMLLSPKPRWHLQILNSVCAAIFLCLAYLVAIMVQVAIDGFNSLKLWEFVSYIVSIYMGFGLVALATYALKFIRVRLAYRMTAWSAFAVVTVVAVYSAVKLSIWGTDSWILGVTGAANTINVFVGVIPITVINASYPIDLMQFSLMVNFALGSILWTAAWLISQKPQNYLHL